MQATTGNLFAKMQLDSFYSDQIQCHQSNLFVSKKGKKEVNELQGLLLSSILSKDSKIGDIKLQNNIIQEFSLKKPEKQHYTFEHSKLKNGCYKIDVYPPGVQNYAFEIRFCVEQEKAATVDKYRVILEDKQLGKKIFE